MEAFGLYGEQRLADCIHELKKRGYRIDTQMRVAPNGRKYGQYTFAAEGRSPDCSTKELEPA